MSRIRKAYESRFRALLRELNARRIEQGVRWWSDHARQLSQRDGISPTHAFERSVCLLRQRVDSFDGRRLWPDVGDSAPESRMKSARKANPAQPDARPRFLCDAGLGGLARWLRAAGY